MAEVGQVTEYVSINGKRINERLYVLDTIEMRLFATDLEQIADRIEGFCAVSCEIERNPPPNVVGTRMIIKGTAEEVSHAKKMLTVQWLC